MNEERTNLHLQVPWWQDMVMYWIEDQIAIAFHSEEEPSVAGDSKDIIASLRLDDLNEFLKVRGFELLPFTKKDVPHAPKEMGEQYEDRGLNSLYGKYLFSSPTDRGTLVVGFFHVKTYEMHHPVQGMTSMLGSAGMHGGGESNARQIANIINSNVEKLRNDGKIPIVAAMPNWIGGATCFGHGCSSPPVPVQNGDACASPKCWTIELPDLSATMRSLHGNGVTMFVLDSMPMREQIEKAAAEDAAGNNLLLQDIVAQIKQGTISFHNQILPEKLWENADDQLVTGRDIYGRAAGFPMPDHGLFVIGILRDLAAEAKIEWMRTVNDFGMGDVHMLINGLEKIQKRMATDLHNHPVVITLPIVYSPPQDELPQVWFSADGSFQAGDLGPMMRNIELLRTPLHLAIQSLTAQGAVIVAGAGNDSNSPDMPMRLPPRYPAAFPEVIAVGAVDKNGNAALYSDYPSLPPRHNGIATYGGGLPLPESHAGSMTTATHVDALQGVFSSPTYPALSANDPQANYEAPNKSAWAYWPGTSFATPIISALAARVLEKMQSSNMHLPSHLWASHVQWAIMTAKGQETMLTGNGPLPLQSEFGVSMLRCVQECKRKEKEEG
jgi:Subtilase family